MFFSNGPLNLPASWNLGGAVWQLDRPLPYAREAASLPEAYVRATDFRNLEARASRFYEHELDAHFGVKVLGRPPVDSLAHAAIESRFQAFLSTRGNEPLPYYYGYFEGNDASGNPSGLPLRMVGLLPKARRAIFGVLVDLRGYGHGIDHDWNRTAAFLDNGFAVFTPDRAEHGLSARLDPRKAALRGTDVFVRHVTQSLTLVRRFRDADERLQNAPLFAIASSFGAAELVGAMRRERTDFGLSAVHFDNPFFSFGPRHGSIAQSLMALVRGAFAVYPEISSEFGGFYRKRRPPSRYERQSDASYGRSVRYFEAFGPTRHPIGFLDLNRLVAENREWLTSDNARHILPRSLMTFSVGDDEVDVDENVRIYRAFARDDRDGIRATDAHSPFLAGSDGLLAEDVAHFFSGGVPRTPRIMLGPQGDIPPFNPTSR